MMFKKLLAVLTTLLLIFPIIPLFASQDTFLVLKEVYPFQEPDKTLANIDTLCKQDYPIALGIMPIYQNSDYPAMKEFVEVLKYAKAKGCRLLLHFPIIQNQATIEQIRAKTQETIKVYKNLGIEFQGILCDENDRKYNDLSDDLEDILPVFHLNEGDFQFGSQLETYLLKTDKLPLLDYQYQPTSIPTNYDFNRNIVKNITYNLENTNQILLVIVTISIIIFISMMIYARRLNKKSFLSKEDK